jgi:hypothetical protein
LIQTNTAVSRRDRAMLAFGMRASSLVLVLMAFLGPTSADHVPKWLNQDFRAGEMTSRRLSNTVGTVSNANDLDETGCSATVADGGWGYCGPASCVNEYITCEQNSGGGPATVNGVTGEWNSAAGNSGGSCEFFSYPQMSQSSRFPLPTNSSVPGPPPQLFALSKQPVLRCYLRPRLCHVVGYWHHSLCSRDFRF